MFQRRRLESSGTAGSNVDPNRSKRKRVADGAKILLDVANESSDWFPPLKSALGGVSALIKHYEEFGDLKERIGDLKPQLDRFRKNIATNSIDGDPGETERRRELTSALEEIGERSQALLDKTKAPRFIDKAALFVDKKRDSGEVVKLVELLRDAITGYQVSQQQAIYDQITSLTSSFNTVLRLNKKSTPLKNKLDSAIARLDHLCLQDDDNDGLWDGDGDERQAKLFDALRRIRDTGNALYHRITAEGYKESQDDVQAVSGIAEDIRDALLDHQMAQQQAIYDQSCRLIDNADLSVLNNCRRAQGAEHRHGNRRGCLKGTRETVLSEIESWVKDFNQSPVFWLNGLAGTGKSTIAQTVSERVFADGQLGASFFCSRDFEDRSDLGFIFPTLAFQLAHKFPEFRSDLVPLLQSNPDVVHESLYRQMEKLIVDPLRSADISTVIAIDALDECKDEEPSSAILSVLGRLVERIPKVKFFITGRPEPRIRTGFRLPILVNSTEVFVLHDVDPPLINNDIRLFLKHELSELAERRQLGGWPSGEHIDLLCKRAAGLFVYAVATIKFLDSNIHLPKHRLDVIVNLPECTAPEGKTRFNRKTTLDSLYTSILQAAFSEEDPEVYPRVRSTLGAVILVVNPLPPSGIAELVGLDPEEVVLFLTLIQSLLTLGENINHPVKSFHKSFPDFVTDPSRCTDTRIYISPKDLHLQLAMNCLRMMNDGLVRNLLSLPDYALNSEVEDIQTRVNDRISIALQYACRSWHNHLTEIGGDVANVISNLRIFLEEKFLAWLEVVSVIGAVGGAVVALERLMAWLQKTVENKQILDIAKDCFQFVTKFFEVINVSATHIYHSALELCPMSSIIRKLYYRQRITCSPRVIVGNPELWAQTIGTSGKDPYNGPCAWSPCGRSIAAQTGKAVEIRNQLTLELITLLQPTETTPHLTGPLAYSPDGRSIACASDTAILIWDIQTGGVAKEIKCSPKNISLVWSSSGGAICTINSEDQVTFIAHTYDIPLGTASSTGTLLHSEDNPHLWCHDESFKVMTTVRGKHRHTINISQVDSTLTDTQSFSPPLSDVKIGSFSPATHRISTSADETLRILDIRKSEFLLITPDCHFLSHCFSSDGSLFAASHESAIHIWKYDSGYTLWREFQCQGWSNSPLRFSPALSSFLGHSGDILQVWRLHELPTAPTNDRQPYVGISRSGAHVAVSYKMEQHIKIINLLSHTHSTNYVFADTMVEGFALTGNVLLVAGSGKLVAWLLPEDELVSGSSGAGRVDPKKIIWTISMPPRGRGSWKFLVEGHIGVIGRDGNVVRVYQTETGKVLRPTQAPRRFNGRRYDLGEPLCGRDYLSYHNLFQPDTPPEDSWQTSRATLREGWVKDAEGKRRLWVPIEWRTDWDPADWRHDVTIQFSILEGRPVLVKF